MSVEPKKKPETKPEPKKPRCTHESRRRTTGFDPYSDFVCLECGAPC